MAASFILDIYTPAGVVAKGITTTDLTIPTTRGEINVLPEHTHIITELETGVLSAKTAEGTRHFSITAGICKVVGDNVKILAMTSEKAEDIDLDRAKSALEKASKLLSGERALNDDEIVKYRRKVDRANTRMRLGYLRGQ